MTSGTTRIAMLLYPGLTQLDLTGPFEVLARLPGSTVDLVWKNLQPVRADSGMSIVPTATLDAATEPDVLFVPGGPGQREMLDDAEVLAYCRHAGQKARYVTSVCTGSLLLGAAGLLEGYEATTHWAYTELLPLFGARPRRARIVVDRNRVTAGGVTAGIDFGLRLVAELVGEALARTIQLALEYDPDPPFRSGHPDVADPALVSALVERRFGERVAVQRQVILARSRARNGGG